MSFRGRVKRVLLRVLRLVFLDTFEFVLRPIRVNTEAYNWIREFVTYIPGRIGWAYRDSFYGRYLKHRPSSFAMSPSALIEHPQELSLGERVGFNRHSWINAVGGLKIGNDVLIGPFVIVHTASHNFGDPDKSVAEQGWTYKAVVIEDDVWIGGAVIILPGSHIGRGAVIGAGSIVSGVIEPYAVVHGDKARTVRSRMVADRMQR